MVGSCVLVVVGVVVGMLVGVIGEINVGCNGICVLVLILGVGVGGVMLVGVWVVGVVVFSGGGGSVLWFCGKFIFLLWLMVRSVFVVSCGFCVWVLSIWCRFLCEVLSSVVIFCC